MVGHWRVLVGTSRHCLGLLGNIGHQWGPVGPMGRRGIQWGQWATVGSSGQQWTTVDNSAYSCQTLNMLNPQLVTGEHGLFGDHESEDIPTIFFNFKNSVNFRVSACSKISSTLLYITEDTIGGLSCDITEKNFICYY